MSQKAYQCGPLTNCWNPSLSTELKSHNLISLGSKSFALSTNTLSIALSRASNVSSNAQQVSELWYSGIVSSVSYLQCRFSEVHVIDLGFLYTVQQKLAKHANSAEATDAEPATTLTDLLEAIGVSDANHFRTFNGSKVPTVNQLVHEVSVFRECMAQEGKVILVLCDSLQHVACFAAAAFLSVIWDQALVDKSEENLCTFSFKARTRTIGVLCNTIKILDDYQQSAKPGCNWLLRKFENLFQRGNRELSSSNRCFTKYQMYDLVRVVSDLAVLYAGWGIVGYPSLNNIDAGFKHNRIRNKAEVPEVSPRNDIAMQQWPAVILRKLELSHCPRWTSEETCRLYFMILNGQGTQVWYSSLVHGVEEKRFGQNEPLVFDVNCRLDGDTLVRVYHLPIGASGIMILQHKFHAATLQANMAIRQCDQSTADVNYWLDTSGYETFQDEKATNCVCISTIPKNALDVREKSRSTQNTSEMLMDNFNLTLFTTPVSSTQVRLPTKLTRNFVNQACTSEGMDDVSVKTWYGSTLTLPVPMAQADGPPESRIVSPFHYSSDCNVLIKCSNTSCACMGTRFAFERNKLTSSSLNKWSCPQCNTKMSRTSISSYFPNAVQAEDDVIDHCRDQVVVSKAAEIGSNLHEQLLHVVDVEEQVSVLEELCPYIPRNDLEDQVITIAQRCESSTSFQVALNMLLETVLLPESERIRYRQERENFARLESQNSTPPKYEPRRPDSSATTRTSPESGNDATHDNNYTLDSSGARVNPGDVIQTPYGLGEIVSVSTLDSGVINVELGWGKAWLQPYTVQLVIAAAATSAAESQQGSSIIDNTSRMTLLHAAASTRTGENVSMGRRSSDLYSSLRRERSSQGRSSRSVRRTESHRQYAYWQRRNSNRGLSIQEIVCLPLHRHNNDTRLAARRQCTICQHDLVGGDRIRTLPCFHAYHASCVDEWLTQHCVCPICQENVR